MRSRSSLGREEGREEGEENEQQVEGDRALGMNSLPVAFGIDKAKYGRSRF